MSFRCDGCGNTFDDDAYHYCEGGKYTRDGSRLRARFWSIIGGNPKHDHKWKPRRWADGSLSEDQDECKCGAVRS
jgi:hypothetical protein